MRSLAVHMQSTSPLRKIWRMLTRQCTASRAGHGVPDTKWSCLLPLQDMEWPSRAMGAIQIRTVLSSEADASMSGLVGFQLTLFTVPEWPSSCANRSPLSLCQTCTRQSCIGGIVSEAASDQLHAACRWDRMQNSLLQGTG